MTTVGLIGSVTCGHATVHRAGLRESPGAPLVEQPVLRERSLMPSRGRPLIRVLPVILRTWPVCAPSASSASVRAGSGCLPYYWSLSRPLGFR